MLTAIKIKNFRLFERLEVKRLGRVTLLVGKNNSGKSSFLEALLLYLNIDRGALVLYDLVGLRKNDEPYFLNEKYKLSKRPIRHIFYEHSLPILGEEGINITTNKFLNDDNLEILVEEVFKDKELDGFQGQMQVVAKRGNTKNIIWSENVEKLFSKQVAGLNAKTAYGTHAIGIIYANFNSSDFQFIPTYGTPDFLVAKLWDEIALTDGEHEIIQALKIMDSRIERITFVAQSELDKDRLAKAKVSGVQEPITLKTLGDGVTKLFHILISIANAKDGTLLIDEFENGFHWSVQEKVWTAVFELAEKLNVQVFATTHSRDCVQAFSKVWSENEEAGAFIRLENHEGVVRAEEYDSDMLATSIRAEVEVR